MGAFGGQVEARLTQAAVQLSRAVYPKLDLDFFAGRHRGKYTAGRLSSGWSGEGWQLYQVIVGNRFQGLAGFSPRSKTAFDDECIEASLPELQRHTGASGFARSSTVEINVFIRIPILKFLGK